MADVTLASQRIKRILGIGGGSLGDPCNRAETGFTGSEAVRQDNDGIPYKAGGRVGCAGPGAAVANLSLYHPNYM